MLSKTALENLYIQLSTNSTTENRQLGLQLMNLNQRLLLQKYFNNETSITLPTIAGQQDYKLPQNYSKMKSVTTTIGTITYTLNAEMLYAEIKAEESTTSVLSSFTILNQQPSLL